MSVDLDAADTSPSMIVVEHGWLEQTRGVRRGSLDAYDVAGGEERCAGGVGSVGAGEFFNASEDPWRGWGRGSKDRRGRHLDVDAMTLRGRVPDAEGVREAGARLGLPAMFGRAPRRFREGCGYSIPAF